MAAIPKYILSACLAGEPCRYDGRSKPVSACRALWEQGQAVLVCPEREGGLSIPRSPCEICHKQVRSKDGKDCTKEYLLGAQKVLTLCKRLGITKAILKENSPSCGSCWIYDGTFTGRKIPGEGVTARLLRVNGIQVYNETNWEPEGRT